jgi:CheY-like chemotaxis protein
VTAAHEASAVGAAAPAHVKGRVLVVDDELALARMYARMLASRHEVTIATDGIRAVDLMAQHDFDVVLTDVMMPGLDGLALLDHVRRRDPTACVLLVTGAPRGPDAEHAASVGAVLYLSKPVDLAALRQAVGYAVLVRRAARERAPGGSAPDAPGALT